MSSICKDKYATMICFGKKKVEVAPHQFPITEQKAMWASKGQWNFTSEELQYNGLGMPLPSDFLRGHYRKAI